MRRLVSWLTRAFSASEPAAYLPPCPQDRPAAPSSYALAGVRL